VDATCPPFPTVGTTYPSPAVLPAESALVQHPPPQPSHTPQTRQQTPGNIITWMNPGRAFLNGWKPTIFRIHHDVGLEIGKVIVQRIATALQLPSPSFPSVHGLRGIMMKNIWKKYGITDIREGRCGESLHKCWNDIIEEIGELPAREMQTHITSRMTKTTHQDTPPHYYTHDERLLSAIIVGLTKETSPTMNERWRAQEAPTISIVQKLKREDITDDCNCMVEVPQDPLRPHITLWMRRTMNTTPIHPSHHRRLKGNRLAHREDDKPP
jgi:hypothetical protein